MLTILNAGHKRIVDELHVQIRAVALTGLSSVLSATANELARLAPDRVIIVGGTGAVSEAVRAAVGDYARP